MFGWSGVELFFYIFYGATYMVLFRRVLLRVILRGNTKGNTKGIFRFSLPLFLGNSTVFLRVIDPSRLMSTNFEKLRSEKLGSNVLIILAILFEWFYTKFYSKSEHGSRGSICLTSIL